MIAAIDPGIRGCGVALLTEPGELVAACYAHNAEDKGDGPSAVFGAADAAYNAIRRMVDEHARGPTLSRVAIEVPRVYPGPQQKGDQNDLIPLAAVVYATAYRFHLAGIPAIRYFPRDWKNTVKADVMTARILSKLKPHEQDRIVYPTARATLGHNVIDAIGIGLKLTGRLEPVRVFGGVD